MNYKAFHRLNRPELSCCQWSAEYYKTMPKDIFSDLEDNYSFILKNTKLACTSQ